MTQTLSAGLEIELMPETEKLVMKQLANDELFEFNSRLSNQRNI